jgi:hypothetical protein
MMDDQQMQSEEMPFDGKRMIFGGFEVLVETRSPLPLRRGDERGLWHGTERNVPVTTDSRKRRIARRGQS